MVRQDQAVPVAPVAALQEALAVVVQAAAIHPVVPDQVQAPAPVGEKRKLKVSRGLCAKRRSRHAFLCVKR